MAETLTREHMLRVAVGTLLSLGLVAAGEQTVQNHRAVEVTAAGDPLVQQLGILTAETCLSRLAVPTDCALAAEDWAKTTTTSTPTTLPPEIIKERLARNRAHRTAASVVTPTTVPEAAPGERIDLGIFESTCYALTPKGTQGGPGSIAVDPRVIPMGTRLYVEGYGEGQARDTGGDIKGRRIDVWKPSAADCINNWGRRSVRVWRIT